MKNIKSSKRKYDKTAKTSGSFAHYTNQISLQSMEQARNTAHSHGDRIQLVPFFACNLCNYIISKLWPWTEFIVEMKSANVCGRSHYSYIMHRERQFQVLQQVVNSRAIQDAEHLNCIDHSAAHTRYQLTSVKCDGVTFAMNFSISGFVVHGKCNL